MNIGWPAAADFGIEISLSCLRGVLNADVVAGGVAAGLPLSPAAFEYWVVVLLYGCCC